MKHVPRRPNVLEQPFRLTIGLACHELQATSGAALVAGPDALGTQWVTEGTERCAALRASAR